MTIFNTQNLWYAVAQYGHAVFGVGPTRAAAIAVARDYVDPETDLDDIRDVRPDSGLVPDDGEMVVVRITRSAVDMVEDDGGRTPLVTVGDVLCTGDDVEIERPGDGDAAAAWEKHAATDEYREDEAAFERHAREKRVTRSSVIVS